MFNHDASLVVIQVVPEFDGNIMLPGDQIWEVDLVCWLEIVPQTDLLDHSEALKELSLELSGSRLHVGAALSLGFHEA